MDRLPVHMPAQKPYSRAWARLRLGAVLFALASVLALPGIASAATADQTTAYNRSVAAVKAYNTADGVSKKLHATYETTGTGYTRIRVDVSDLSLTSAQKQQVMDHLYYNTDYWYVDACGDGKYSSKELVYTCIYKDSSIPGMKTKMDAQTAKALAYIKGCPNEYQKVHMLHDWLIKNVDYADGSIQRKLAYSCIAQCKADCMGYAYGMDYLLRKAGFTTAFCLNAKADHIWNLVKFSNGRWYHVDVTWAHTYTGKSFWKDCTCHRWLLLSDKAMNTDEHKGWVVLKNGVKASYKATDTTYDYYGKPEWNARCACTMASGKTFTGSTFKYQVVTTGKTVRVVGVVSKGKTSYSVPTHVWWRGHDYTVTRVGSKAFQDCKKATSISVGSNVIQIASSAFKNCTSLKTLTLKTAKLTSANVKGSLFYSKVAKIKLVGSSVIKKKTAYKSYFKKSNSGRTVTIYS